LFQQPIFSRKNYLDNNKIHLFNQISKPTCS